MNNWREKRIYTNARSHLVPAAFESCCTSAVGCKGPWSIVLRRLAFPSLCYLFTHSFVSLRNLFHFTFCPFLFEAKVKDSDRHLVVIHVGSIQNMRKEVEGSYTDKKLKRPGDDSCWRINREHCDCLRALHTFLMEQDDGLLWDVLWFKLTCFICL